jgi:hypothetical protein
MKSYNLFFQGLHTPLTLTLQDSDKLSLQRAWAQAKNPQCREDDDLHVIFFTTTDGVTFDLLTLIVIHPL